VLTDVLDDAGVELGNRHPVAAEPPERSAETIEQAGDVVVEDHDLTLTGDRIVPRGGVTTESQETVVRGVERLAPVVEQVLPLR
jgi:hypothetical protein